MTEIEKARAEIDRIDGEMARLFAERMDAVRAIAGEKRAQGLPVRDPVREEEMLALIRTNPEMDVPLLAERLSVGLSTAYLLVGRLKKQGRLSRDRKSGKWRF